MKRILSLFLVLVLLMGTVACTPKTPETTTPPTDQNTAPGTDPKPTDPSQSTKTVKITLDANGGSCETTEVELTVDACYGQLPQPQREGYAFLGWYTDPEAGEQILPETQILSQQAHTLYAHWGVQTTFTVTLDPNGGRISVYNSQVTATVGEPYGTMPEPIREGYVFLGWYTEPDAGDLVESTTVLAQAGDLVLYAHWEYNSVAYWTYVLQSRVQTIPQCRRVVVYAEKTSGYKTFITNTLLTDAGAINAAERLEDEVVTDEWIKSVNPYIVVKLSSDIYMAAINKVSMQRRLGDMEIYIFPVSMVNGIDELQIYYRLQLAKILYPEYFADIDLAAIAAEMKINPRIYY